jgi:DNA-binding CsgD family transcriptional regulator
MNLPDPHALIEAIYAGVLAPNGFNDSLRDIKQAFGVEFSYLLLWDRSTDLIRMLGASGLIREFQADYEAHYQFKDPTKASFADINEGDWWIDTQQLGLTRMGTSAFHQEFLRAYGMSSFMASPVFRSPEMEVALGLLRSSSEGVFTRAQAVAIQPYVPHLRRAVLLRERIGALSAAAELTQALLERLPFGVAVIDPRLRLLALNERGRRALTSLGPPSKWSQLLPGSPQSLERMIQAACSLQDPVPIQAVRLRSPNHAASTVLVLPLGAAHRFSHGWQHPAALVAFAGSYPATRLLPEILRELFGLTPSEARMAFSLAGGAPLTDVSDHLRITRETARSTLKIVFRKTGTNSQAQLVRLLAVLSAIGAPPSSV